MCVLRRCAHDSAVGFSSWPLCFFCFFSQYLRGENDCWLPFLEGAFVKRRRSAVLIYKLSYVKSKKSKENERERNGSVSRMISLGPCCAHSTHFIKTTFFVCLCARFPRSISKSCQEVCVSLSLSRTLYYTRISGLL
jgi:hypothetical protein